MPIWLRFQNGTALCTSLFRKKKKKYLYFDSPPFLKSVKNWTMTKCFKIIWSRAWWSHIKLAKRCDWSYDLTRCLIVLFFLSDLLHLILIMDLNNNNDNKYCVFVRCSFYFFQPMYIILEEIFSSERDRKF